MVSEAKKNLPPTSRHFINRKKPLRLFMMKTLCGSKSSRTDDIILLHFTWLLFHSWFLLSNLMEVMACEVKFWFCQFFQQFPFPHIRTFLCSLLKKLFCVVCLEGFVSRSRFSLLQVFSRVSALCFLWFYGVYELESFFRNRDNGTKSFNFLKNFA